MFLYKEIFTKEQIKLLPLVKEFNNEFNERIFREALAYFKDIDCTKKIIYRKGFEIEDAIIKKGLVDFSLS